MRVFQRCVVLHLCIGIVFGAFAREASAQAAAPASRVVGTVKSVSGASVVVTLDNGTDSTVTFADSARIVRATPGQTDLKSALPFRCRTSRWETAFQRASSRETTTPWWLLQPW